LHLWFIVCIFATKYLDMKVLQSSFFRAITAIIVGVLLIKYREETMTWITIATGILFFLSGVISCAAYLGAKKHVEDVIGVDAAGNDITNPKPTFPIVGIGSIILGIILALMPSTFIIGLTYIFAAILILGAINQFVSLASITKFCHVGFYFWIMPSLILLVGLIAVIKPTVIASAPLLVIGWCMLLYGVVECLNTIKIMMARKRKAAADAAAEKMAQEAAQQTQTEAEKSDTNESV
jgi:uncharacterized membrane protein HdeD (DUF308 family)